MVGVWGLGLTRRVTVECTVAAIGITVMVWGAKVLRTLWALVQYPRRTYVRVRGLRKLGYSWGYTSRKVVTLGNT